MIQFLLGLGVGGLSVSLMWGLYLCHFPDDSAALGRRVRRWLKLPPAR